MSNLNNNTTVKFTVHLDMDGVLADFDRSINENEFLHSLKLSVKNLSENVRKKLDENKTYGAAWHMKDLGELLRGPQTDADLDRLKRKYNFLKSKQYEFASKEGFFANLPKMPDADALINGVIALSDRRKPNILSSQLESSKTCIYEKKLWIQTYYSDKVDKVNIQRDKNEYAVMPDMLKLYPKHKSILIDDTPKKIRGFINAGGIGILHTSAEKSLAELEEIINKSV